MGNYSGAGGDPNWGDLDEWGDASGPQKAGLRESSAFQAAQGSRGAAGREYHANAGNRNLGDGLRLASGMHNLANAPQWTAGTRALNMAAYTENYLSPNVKGWFGKSSGGMSSAFKTSAGKYVAEAFGWNFEAGTGKVGTSARYMGESTGFLGSKFIAKHGMAGAAKMGGFWMQAAGGLASGAYTLYAMGVGYQEDGIAGAAMGLGESVLSAAIFRKAFIPALSVLGNGAAIGGGRMIGGFKPGYAAARAATVGRITGGVASSAGAFQAARAAGIGAGIIGGGLAAGAAGIVAAVASPLFWLTSAAIYAGGKVTDYIEHNDRAVGRQRQIRAMEMGAPIADQYGTISTLRQRSLAAIQNSHVNGRMALGNEAALLH
jgi:hypothetical protein